jgi:RND superfamily putative drug exporter
VRVPRWLRILLPAALILVWLTAASIGGPYFGRIDEVSSNDQTTYLPASADATRVSALQKRFTDSEAIPAIVVFRTDDGAELTDEQRADIQSRIDEIATVSGVTDGSSPAIPSEDGEAIEVFVPIDSTGEVRDTVDSIRSFLLGEGSVEGVTAFVTGPAGFTADIGDAFAGIDGILLLTALGAVFLILFIVYRSPLLPFLVLGTSLFALTTSLLTVWWLAKAGVFTLNGQVQASCSSSSSARPPTTRCCTSRATGRRCAATRSGGTRRGPPCAYRWSRSWHREERSSPAFSACSSPT